ncbi:MAG: hypothetical protein OXC19_25430 [Bryobacterales bacterium]|nr:hypothetical protein [Bryobacterales bacterium]
MVPPHLGSGGAKWPRTTAGGAPAPEEIAPGNDNPGPNIVALADPGGEAIEIPLNLMALRRRPRSIFLG